MHNVKVYPGQKTFCDSVAPASFKGYWLRGLIGLFLPWSLALTAVAQEPPVPLGPSFEVSEDRERAKQRPRIAALDAGRFVVVWEEDIRSASDEAVGIQGRLFDSVGRPEGPAFQVNAYTTGRQREPVVGSWPDGRFVVAYSSEPEYLLPDSTTDVRARVFSRFGQPEGAEVQVVSELEPEFQKLVRHDVAALDSGDFLVTWERFEESSIVGQRIAADGTMAEPFFVTEGSGSHGRPAVAALDGGGFVVAWETVFNVDNRIRTDVFGRTYGADGEAMGDFIVDEPISYELWRLRPDVAATAPGEFVVAWRSYLAFEYFEPMERVHTRRFDASGLALAPPVEVSAEEGFFSFGPRVAGRSDGSFSVVWSPHHEDFEPRAVSLRAMEADDTPRGDVLRLAEGDALEEMPDLANLPRGQTAAVWRTFQFVFPDSISGIDGQRVGLQCIPADDVLCLNDGRFRVTVQWRDARDRTGVGRLVDNGTSDDSGLFWFFAPNNWELLLKVIDGCAFNDHYWVFAAATTDVEYTLEVVDTHTGAKRVYTNPLGQASDAVTDTEALAGCP